MKRRMILAVAPALLATAAVAQPAPPPMPPMPHMSEVDMKAHHAAMQKQHMEDLKIVLRLRPDQEPALAAFMAAHEPKTFTRKLPEPSSLTTPQRLEEMSKVEAEMDAHRKAARDALTRFYAALSPDQQKVFDALHRLKGHDGPGGHGGRFVMHGGPGGHGGHGGGPNIMIMRGHGPGGPDHDAPR